MGSPPEKQDWRRMRRMFGTIAPWYDFVTRAFSFGMDRRWKQTGVRNAPLPQGALVLDLACGTGDFATLMPHFSPGVKVVALDLTPEMLRRSRRRGVQAVVCGNALALPFADATFNAVVVGYGLRNFPGLGGALGEICRVTRPGGLLVSLDFFLPEKPLLRRLYLGWLYAQGAAWGLLLHGRPRVYTYIPASLRSFVSIQGLSRMLERTGYDQVRVRSFIAGGIGLHWAVKGKEQAGTKALAPGSQPGTPSTCRPKLLPDNAPE